MNKLFLDANILMEILFQRRKYTKIVELLEQYSMIFTSFLSAHILMYFTELEKLDFQNTLRLLENIIILDNTENTFELAKSLYKGNDFEDCIQVATCLENNIPNFLTLDKNLAKKHSDKLNVIML